MKDAAVNSSTDPTKYRFRPKNDPSHPVRGMTITEARM